MVGLFGAIIVSGCGSSGPSAPFNLAYPQGSIHATVGKAISPDTPTVSGTVTQYSVSPNLPSGLTLSSTTGAISGTPTASTPEAAYTVTAQNSKGFTTATVQVVITVPAPTNLAYPQTVIRATAAQPVMPDIPVFTGTEISFSVSPALPAGLSVDSGTGILSGTPEAAAAQEAFTITAQNSGGSATATVTTSVLAAPNVLLDLGHANQIQAIRMTSDRVLSVDQAGHWVLWNYRSGANLANGEGSPYQVISRTQVFAIEQIDMAGTIYVVAIPNGLEIRSTADGHLLSIVVYPGIAQVPVSVVSMPWWQLASDGSYVIIGSSTGIAAYSSAGQVLMSKSGDYSGARTFSAPGKVLVALGHAGASVIETISVSDGSSTTSPSFSGQFHSWFLDGARFLTNEQNSVWVYSSAGAQQAIVSLPNIDNLTGEGNWIVTYASSTPGYPLEIYPIGAETPALSFAGDVSTTPVASGNTFAVLAYGTGEVTVFDLSGSTPARSDASVPLRYLTTYAAASGRQWVVGNQHGALADGASLSGTPRYLGYGQAWSIAGSSANAAVSAASGRILVLASSGPSLPQSIPFSSSKVSLSADGSLLGAMANANDYQYAPDRTLNFYSLPSGSVVKNYPYMYQYVKPFLVDFSLAGSGTTISQTQLDLSASNLMWQRKITSLDGNTVVWSDSPITVGPNPPVPAIPILFSPDGTFADVYAGGSGADYATNILKNGKLVTALPGVALGWIDNNRLLVNSYQNVSGSPQYTGAIIYDATGAKIASPPLPELQSIQAVSADSVYDPSRNAIYSLTTGQPTWTGAYPGSGIGAVSGSTVVYESGHSIVKESY